MEEFQHAPVLLRETLDALAVRPGARCFDGTLGGGGHARALLEASAPDGTLLALDRDPAACAAARARLAPFGGRATVVNAAFADLDGLMAERGLAGFDAMLLDLGVSSPQFDRAERGFSFAKDGPLDMRMGEGGRTAADLVNALPEKELADLFYLYGEERRSRRVARRIVERRRSRPFERTADLADVVRGAFPPEARRGRIHPATRVFQALRIAVNDELGQLERFLAGFERRLAPGGRLAILSYHSLEDRLVKEAFREAERAGRARRVTRKAIRPSEEEKAANARARSAKLRAAERPAAEAAP